ncbi:alpha/beta fold hydrolase [Emticicia sp. C21]|uniref:alpha/beta fold hydrolase n=1 Tax=Emticicia sp. C21 TaxID=2302915 RepID=UPI000E351E98|nr:alpha/beta fold hydrolase [Emticicia sp. C21]RFS17761.1 alpha/beta fold hydrolase [Emticicia sp. C21]
MKISLKKFNFHFTNSFTILSINPFKWTVFVGLLFFLTLSSSTIAQKTTIDTLVNVGDYQLHFMVIPGKGTPILFEAGGGNDGQVWSRITKPISEITQAPIITYDRIGLGKSTKDNATINIEKEVEVLNTALKKLGFTKDLMLVSHSIGGFYQTLFANQNAKRIKAMVMIDTNLPCFFTEEQLVKMKASDNFRHTIEVVKQNPLPLKIPVVDIVSEQTLFEGTPDAQRWKDCHNDFVAAYANRTSLVAYQTGHYVFLSNPQLVINTIVTQYANKVRPGAKAAIFKRGYKQEQVAANEDRRNQMKYAHSENDLNEWGYAMLKRQEILEAIEIFKLNVLLHPNSENVYDSLGDAYVKAGQKDLAIANYQKALDINPKKESSKKMLKLLSN